MKEKNNKQRFITPEVDIFDTENDFILKAEMPGVSKEDLEIHVVDNQLEIIGHVNKEYKELTEKTLQTYQEFELVDYRRTFNLGNIVNEEKIEATVNNGLLTLTLPKSEKVKPRKILVTTG